MYMRREDSGFALLPATMKWIMKWIWHRCTKASKPGHRACVIGVNEALGMRCKRTRRTHFWLPLVS